MLTPDGTKYRIRYSRPYRPSRGDVVRPKNTLVTVQDGEYVFFGIARCNWSAKSTDVFNRKEGREIALDRALKARSVNVATNSSFCLNGDGTYGYCRVKLVKTLLKHFESLDNEW